MAVGAGWVGHHLGGGRAPTWSEQVKNYIKVMEQIDCLGVQSRQSVRCTESQAKGLIGKPCLENPAWIVVDMELQE